MILCCRYSVIQSCPTLCNSMDTNTPGFPVLYYLPELAQTHVRRVGDVVQPSHPLSSPFPPTFNLSSICRVFSNESAFVSGDQSIGASTSASVLLMNVQDWFPLGLTALISLQSKGLSRIFSNTTIQNHQFFGVQPSVWSNSHIHTWLLQNSYFGLDRTLSAK